jgi:hypothetical protein
VKRALDLLWRIAPLVVVFAALYAAAISLATPLGVGQLLTPGGQRRSAQILPPVGHLTAAISSQYSSLFSGPNFPPQMP